MQKITNYNNYAIDENGNVFNIITKKQLQGSIGENGYKYYRLSKDNKKKMFYAHRLVAETFIPNPNNLPVVNHIDGNKLNNNITNLEWVSQSQNMQHAYNISLIQSKKMRKYYEQDLKGEEWKPIFNFPYSVSSFGRVRNDRNNLLLQPSVVCGYYKIRLCTNNKPIDVTIHKLVYCVFNNLSSIPKEYVIDHIDGNKLNNNLNNLRLVTLSENVNAAFYLTKTNKSCKKVGQYSKSGQLIKEYPSIRKAAKELHLDSSTIVKVCKGINRSHGGFIFRYLDN